MPTYVYHCSSCDATYEVDQRITADPLTDCIKCETGKVKRIIQPIAVMFKGSGFHINDYSAAPAPAESTTVAPAETKTETPAAAPTAAPAVAETPAAE